MIDWLIETIFAVTILMLAVLAVRRPVAHYFGANWAYALWLLPAMRLVLPPLHVFGDDMPSLFSPVSAIVPETSSGAPASPMPSGIFSWEPILLGLWATGAALFILWQIWVYLSFLRRLGIGSQVHASLAQDIGVVESDEVDGPLAIGLLDRWIVVPTDFTSRYSAQEQGLALKHERIHHQREDIFWNMAALFVLAVNWFNPVAYAAFRAFRTDQELSCDAAVAARASGQERHDYARALIKSASRPGLIAACPLNHAGQLKRRLKMMKQHRGGGLRFMGGATALAALLLAGISMTETPAAAVPEAWAAAPAPLPRLSVARQVKEEPISAPRAVMNAASTPRAQSVRAPTTKNIASPVPDAIPPSIPVAEVPQPARAVERFVIHMEGAPAETIIVPHSRELRIFRTRLRTAQAIDPAWRAKAEKIIAHRMALAEATGVRHFIIKHN